MWSVAEETGYSDRTVTRYLDDKYKNPKLVRTAEQIRGDIEAPPSSSVELDAIDQLGPEENIQGQPTVIETVEASAVELDAIDRLGPEKYDQLKLIANKFRRQVTAEEVKGWINDLAEIALTEHKIQPGRISGWIAEETGYSTRQVQIYLNPEYKNRLQSERATPKPGEVASPETTAVELDAIDQLGPRVAA